MNEVDIETIFEYIQRMTKAERKVADMKHALMVFQKQVKSGEIQTKGLESLKLLQAFIYAMNYILEVKE